MSEPLTDEQLESIENAPHQAGLGVVMLSRSEVQRLVAEVRWLRREKARLDALLALVG